MRKEKSKLFYLFYYVLFCIRLRSSTVSVVFSFNASLNDVAPFSLIRLSVDIVEYQECTVGKSSGILFKCSPVRLSFVSVVFDFNKSPNDVVPFSPILLSGCI